MLKRLCNLHNIVFASTLCLAFPLIAVAEECIDGSAVSPIQIADVTSDECCSQSSDKKRRRCINRALRTVKSARATISSQVAFGARVAIKELRAKGCNMNQANIPACSNDTSTTVNEAISLIENNACGLKFASSRQSRLKKLRRKLNRAKKYIGASFSNTILTGIRQLQNSRTCGKGGEQGGGSGGCSRTIDPRDGANGNVYKLGDHTHTPVFVTHNSAGHGKAITRSGEFIESLQYTGKGNPDQRGLRDHYRLGRSCTSYPTFYLLQIGSTCYEINNRCGRID